MLVKGCKVLALIALILIILFLRVLQLVAAQSELRLNLAPQIDVSVLGTANHMI